MNKLVKILAVAVLGLMLSTTTVFAMAQKPPAKSKQWYTDEARNRCLQFGDFWAPNFRYEVTPNIWIQPGNVPSYKLDENGNRIELITCDLAPKAKAFNYKTNSYVEVPAVACFDTTKPEFKYDELVACQKPYLDYAFNCFDAQGKKIANCGFPDPA